MDEEEKPFLNAGSSGSQRKNSKNGRGILKYLLPAGLLLHLILFVGNIFVFVSREIQSRNETCYSHFPNRAFDILL